MLRLSVHDYNLAKQKFANFLLTRFFSEKSSNLKSSINRSEFCPRIAAALPDAAANPEGRGRLCGQAE